MFEKKGRFKLSKAGQIKRKKYKLKLCSAKFL